MRDQAPELSAPKGPIGDAATAIAFLSKVSADNFKSGTGIGLQGLGGLHLAAGVGAKVAAGLPLLNFVFSSLDFAILMSIGAIFVLSGSAIKVFEFYSIAKRNNAIINGAVEEQKLLRGQVDAAHQRMRDTV